MQINVDINTLLFIFGVAIVFYFVNMGSGPQKIKQL